MTENERRILEFCIDKWARLATLEKQIPRSTLYRVAKNLCGRSLLLHRKARGYRTTERGTQILKENQGRVERLKEGRLSEKAVLIEAEEKIKSKKPPVNLSAIKKLLGLSDKTINSFLSLYPPLKKVPTPTHEAMIELLWAERCDRSSPISDFHHLSFLNFGDTLTWKTEEARFCAYMVAKEGEDISSYIIEPSLERGYSLWIRGSSSGERIFKREILENPYVCLEDYQNTDTDSKRAVGHLLLGRIKVDWQNILETISCVAMVNLNPREGKTLFQKTGFDKPKIRRLIPCDLDAIKLPHLEKIGQEAIEAAKNFGPLSIEEPKFDCTPYRNELIDYRNNLFTEEGQSLIDVEGLLNLARGFTGYDFTASEAIRYTLYKASLPYHTLGWLKPEWVEGFRKETRAIENKKMLIPEIETGKETTQVPVKAEKEDLGTLQNTIKFQEKHEDELNKLEKFSIEIEEFKKFLKQKELYWERIDQILLEEGHKVPSPERCENAVREIEKKYKRIQRRDWPSLEKFKEANNWLNGTYIKPLIDSKQRIKIYKEYWDYIREKISNIKKISQISLVRQIIDKSPLVPSQKHTLKEMIDKKKTVLEQQRQTKIRKLVDYLQEMKELGNSSEYEKMRKQARDITEDLLGLEVIKKENNQLRGKDGQSYSLDMFNLPKYIDTFLITLGWKPACCRALTLLTGVEDKTLAADKKYRQNLVEFLLKSSADQRARQQKKTGVEVIQGNLALERWLSKAKCYFSNRKKARQQITKPKGTTPPSPIPSGKPIGREVNESKLTSEPQTTPSHQYYYKGHPVEIIDQGEYSYTIRDESGEDIAVLKREVTLKK